MVLQVEIGLPPAVDILNVPISAIDITTAVDCIASWIGNPAGRYICAADVHSVMLTRTDARHREAMCNADMVTPDGMPLVWVSHLLGRRNVGRVCGTDLLLACCDASQRYGWRHFFYGGAPGVADRVVAVLKARYPRLQVAGTFSPPFGAVSEVEDAEFVSRIRSAAPDIVWVGLGCPKQELWMRDHAPRIPHATLIGIGAAFDFVSGRIQRAPGWMQRRGLEGVFRLLSDPRRLWRRYLLLAPKFIALASGHVLAARVAARFYGAEKSRT